MVQRKGLTKIPLTLQRKHYAAPPLEINEGELANQLAWMDNIKTHAIGLLSLYEEGNYLATIIGLTSQRSFLDYAMGKVIDDASFANTLAGLLHTSHTYFSSQWVNLPWISIFINEFSSTVIPENVAKVEDAEESLDMLTALMSKRGDFYKGIMEGRQIASISGDSVYAPGIKIDFYANDSQVAPIRIKHNQPIRIGDDEYNNLMPLDRVKFPSFAVEEGSKLKVRLENTTPDKLYALVPTINGIPIHIKQISLHYDGLQSSSLPVHGIAPDPIYLKPGESIELDKIFCNETILSNSFSGGFPSALFDTSDELAELAYAFRDTVLQRLDPSYIQTLERADRENPGLAERMIYQTSLRFVQDFMKLMKGALETDVYLSRAEEHQYQSSSELPNPNLGTFGLCIVEVSKPPVQDRHTMHFSSYDGMNSRSVTMAFKGGDAGLGHIAGGPDQAAKNLDWMASRRYDDLPHTFVGYVPVNLIGLTR